MRLTSPAARRTCYGLLVVALLAALWLTADRRLALLAVNTSILAAAVSVLSLSLGVPLAFLLVRTNLTGRRAAGVLLIATLFVPLHIHAAAWLAAAGLQGALTLWFDAPAIIDGWAGAIWIHTAGSLPWTVLIVGLALWWAEPELEEDALLATSAWRALSRVTLRRVMPAAAAAALWAALTTAGEMSVTDLFQIRTFAEEVYTDFALGGEPDTAPLGNAPATILLGILVLGALLLVARLAPADASPMHRPATTFKLGAWRLPLALGAWAVLLALVAVPVVSLAYKAGAVVVQQGDDLLHTWSPQKALAITTEAPIRYSHEFGWSVSIASLAASLTLIIAIPLAWKAYGSRPWQLLACCVPAFLLAIPGPLLGIVVIRVMDQPGATWLNRLYDNSLLPTAMVQCARALPLGILVLWHMFRTIPVELIQAARADGAAGLVLLRKIVLPQRMAALALAWLASFALAMGELPATLLVVPPGVIPLSVQIFNLIHYGVDDLVAGICLVLIACFSLLGLAVMFLAGRRQRTD